MAMNLQPELLPSSGEYPQRILCQLGTDDYITIGRILCKLKYPCLWPSANSNLPVARLDARMSKNPLRIIVSRQVQVSRLGYGSTITTYHEILECGHIYSDNPILPEQFSAKRRRCAACGAGIATIPLHKVLPIMAQKESA